jgi:hypothetical protein
VEERLSWGVVQDISKTLWFQVPKRLDSNFVPSILNALRTPALVSHYGLLSRVYVRVCDYRLDIGFIEHVHTTRNYKYS